MLKLTKYPPPDTWPGLLVRPQHDFSELEKMVSPIIIEVKKQGDDALRKFTQKFDGVTLHEIRVEENEITRAENKISSSLKKAIATAIKNIEKFHKAQKEKTQKTETSKGVVCWRKAIAIEKVGLYIPGGSAPLFSTLLMLGIPAKIAGCREIVLCTPPGKNGTVSPEILYCTKLIGITNVFKAGGAQAIAAMAYGTETIPKVYKIFGPGNQFVTAAKMLLNKDGIAIDMPAGPSEVCVIADETCKPAFVAADLLSQAEHGADSQVILISCNEPVIHKIQNELKAQINLLPRKNIAVKALKNSRAILVKNLDEAIRLSNEYAPEHLILSINSAEKYADKITNAGSVFIGNYSPESAGDYVSGTNHTLPTNGFAKAYSGVSLDSFMKKITFQKLSKKGLQNLAPAIESMAEAEGLMAHKLAVKIRL